MIDPVYVGARVVMIDNYDSFTYNLVQYLLELGAEVEVLRNDAEDVDAVLARAPTHIVLSPGPGRPCDAGVCQGLCRELARTGAVPLLGVCLGHQTLCEVLGATVTGASRIMHGKTSPVLHDGSGVFAALPSPLQATRYHSLIALEPSLPEQLIANARTPEGELMGVRHRALAMHGVQFHPESILTEHGHALLGNFLAMRPHPGARQ
jgi:anthranilate synthase/aminodeoxychorismate synthase-like glutamine amidotransferase